MTNHIIQVSLDMDTEHIQKIIEEQAAKQIIADIQRSVEEALFKHATLFNPKPTANNRNGFSDLLQHKIDEYLEEIKPDVIEITAKKLAERLSRTKAVKEATEGVLKNEGN